MKSAGSVWIRVHTVADHHGNEIDCTDYLTVPGGRIYRNVMHESIGFDSSLRPVLAMVFVPTDRARQRREVEAG